MTDQSRVQIGNYHLTQPETRRKHYECAAWYTEILLSPQVAPIYATLKKREREYEWGGDMIESTEIKDNSICWELKGVVTDAYFPSLFGGVMVTGTDPRRPRDIGKEERIYCTPYAHAMALGFLEGKEEMEGIELFPEFVPLYCPYSVPCYHPPKYVEKTGEIDYGFTAGIYHEPELRLRARSWGVERGLKGESIPTVFGEEDERKGPDAVFGWSCAMDQKGRDKIGEGERNRDSARGALRMYGAKAKEEQKA